MTERDIFLAVFDLPDPTGPATTVPRVNRVLLGDNLRLLREIPDGTVQMAYADPPFNTGRTQVRRSVATVGAADGDRTGFGGRRYATRLLAESSYRDDFEDYLGEFVYHCHRVDHEDDGMMALVNVIPQAPFYAVGANAGLRYHLLAGFIPADFGELVQ